jgi:hypothetical protein
MTDDRRLPLDSDDKSAPFVFEDTEGNVWKTWIERHPERGLAIVSKLVERGNSQ